MLPAGGNCAGGLGVFLQTLPCHYVKAKLSSLPLSLVVSVMLTFRGALWDLSISLSRP